MATYLTIHQGWAFARPSFKTTIMFTTTEKEQVLNLAQNFTAAQIAESTGLKYNDIYAFVKRSGIDPLTEGDQIKNRLYKEAHRHTKVEMHRLLAISYDTFKKYIQETGVVFKVESHQSTFMEENADMVVGDCGPHFKDQYTQSGSPYGIADELR